ncbi:hypothetical protein [Acidicapsa acidisoli]|uniref:hypothetical protein n=1 Tax=Acidicapsa acidisoli TaxID=1615681 RepID=UPI0021E0622B|nr:hypothetical protein [Acidicapsa acidisoli]
MDKTESAVRTILTAIETPLYDVGVMSDRGMLPGIYRIPASAVLARLSLLKYRNAHGVHIRVRPFSPKSSPCLKPVDAAKRTEVLSRRGRLQPTS